MADAQLLDRGAHSILAAVVPEPIRLVEDLDIDRAARGLQLRGELSRGDALVPVPIGRAEARLRRSLHEVIDIRDLALGAADVRARLGGADANEETTRFQGAEVRLAPPPPVHVVAPRVVDHRRALASERVDGLL